MAEASAAVERRKASASPPKGEEEKRTRGRARSASRWQHPMRGEAPRDSCAFSALRLPLFFGGKSLVALVGKTRARVRRENRITCFTLPCRGRVAARRDAGWGARRRREFAARCARFHPIPPRCARRPSPLQGKVKKWRSVTSSTGAWRCRSGFLPCLRRRAARCASSPAPAGS